MFRAEVRFVGWMPRPEGRTASILGAPSASTYSVFPSRRCTAYFPDIDRISIATGLIEDRAPRALLVATPLQVQQENLGEKR